MSAPGIIFPRQTQSTLSLISGALANGDQVTGEIIVPSTGVYICGFAVWGGGTAIAAPRALELVFERQSPTPLQSFKIALLGVDTSGQGGQWSGRMLLRGQAFATDGVTLIEQWSYLVRLRTTLPALESFNVQLTLTPVAYVLGLLAGQERLNTIEIEDLHQLKLAL